MTRCDCIIRSSLWRSCTDIRTKWHWQFNSSPLWNCIKLMKIHTLWRIMSSGQYLMFFAWVMYAIQFSIHKRYGDTPNFLFATKFIYAHWTSPFLFSTKIRCSISRFECGRIQRFQIQYSELWIDSRKKKAKLQKLFCSSL